MENKSTVKTLDDSQLKEVAAGALPWYRVHTVVLSD